MAQLKYEIAIKDFRVEDFVKQCKSESIVYRPNEPLIFNMTFQDKLCKLRGKYAE